MIDTHAHIYLPEFSEDIHEVVKLSKHEGIEKIFMPNINVESIEAMLSLEKQYTNYCIPMMGLHPCYVKADYKDQLHIIERWLNNRQFCAIGEIGLDLYWDKTFIDEQIIVLETQISWAKELGLPIVLHCRESLDMTLEFVQKHQDGRLKGIFHCFSGNIEQANKIIDLNFLMGIGGILTFKNGGLDNVMPDIKLEYLVLETDSPYLAPVPFRGKRNTPSYLTYIADRLAKLKNCDVTEVIKKTSENAEYIFHYE